MTSPVITLVFSSPSENNISIRAPSLPKPSGEALILLISIVSLNAWVEGMKYLSVKFIVFVSLEPLTFISKVALVFSFNLIAIGKSFPAKSIWYLSTSLDKNRIVGFNISVSSSFIFSGCLL